jgi:hypothetical protein
MRRAIIVRRIAISMLVGLVIGVIVSELSFYLLNNGQTRPPKLVEIDIPAGTALRVARGEADTSLPASMTFVVGDTLLVRNLDTATHQLGPLLIPAGASASMKLATEQGYSLLCSFEPSKYLQLTVLPPLTIATRIVGILEAGLNVGFLIAVYAVFAIPMKQKEKVSPA